MDTTKLEVEQIALNQIDMTNVLYQVREKGVESSHVNSFVYSDSSKWPPILLTRGTTDERYVIVSGWHRTTAANILKHESIAARVISQIAFTKEQLLEIAYEENRNEQIPLSKKEKLAYASLLYQMDKKITWIELSKKVGLSDHTVKNHIEQKFGKDDNHRKHSDAIENLPEEQTQLREATKIVNKLAKAINEMMELASNVRHAAFISLLVDNKEVVEQFCYDCEVFSEQAKIFAESQS